MLWRQIHYILFDKFFIQMHLLSIVRSLILNTSSTDYHIGCYKFLSRWKSVFFLLLSATPFRGIEEEFNLATLRWVIEILIKCNIMSTRVVPCFANNFMYIIMKYLKIFLIHYIPKRERKRFIIIFQYLIATVEKCTMTESIIK